MTLDPGRAHHAQQSRSYSNKSATLTQVGRAILPQPPRSARLAPHPQPEQGMPWTQPPAVDEYPPAYADYVGRVSRGADVLDVLARQLEETSGRLAGISEDRGGFRYAPGKWSLKELVGHLNDAERIMVYRALRFARGDAAPLAGFDENAYVPQSGADA